MPRETQELELTSQNHSAAPRWVLLQAALCHSSPTQPHALGTGWSPIPGAEHAGKHCQEREKPGTKPAEQSRAELPTISVLEPWEQES